MTSYPGSREASRRLQTGARLVRECNGVSHVVEVTEGGLVWNGDRHRSLSAIARAITQAILDGRQPIELTAKRLKRICDLPVSWAEQRRVLGFA